ncbi:hypothetical protein GW796_05585 [archaeon]|nr:hypothetical protein [archaeon]NCQ51356.1 hypothetical protein [archaeon]NCT58818.1 hypothetical protein [archaeon]
MKTFKQFITEKIFYRGLSDKYDPSYKTHIEWFSETEELAKDYAGNEENSTIITKNLSNNIIERSFQHGFRTAFTEIKASDFISRIKNGINIAFKNKWISREEGIKLFDEIDNLDLPKGFKRVFDWWNSYPPFINILKKAGYKSIHNIENNINTYGVFK